MSRKLPITYSAKNRLPKLMIMGSSVLEGRKATLLRIRPTVVRRLESLTYGPLYLLIEHALIELCNQLEQTEEGKTQALDAASMNPTPEDKELIEAESRVREDMQAKKAMKKEAA